MNPGDAVRVRRLDAPGHHRTPLFVQGQPGVIVGLAAKLPDPELLAYARPSGDLPVWRVRFQQTELWPDYTGGPADGIVVDLYEHWLEPAP